MSTSQPPETFLAFVLDIYLDRDGQYWACPLCQRTNGSVSVNEPLKDHAIKCRCRSGWCEWPVPGRGYGDEYDVLRWFHPGVKFPGLKVLRLELWNKWNALRAESVGRTGSGASGPGATAGVARLAPYILPHGERNRYEQEFDGAVAEVWAALRPAFPSPDRPTPRAEYDQFARMVETGYFADRGRVFTDAVLSYWLSFVEWVEAFDSRHLAECDDLGCDTIVCRAARGLPPLTEAELEPGRIAGAARRERKRREREEFARRLRDHNRVEAQHGHGRN